MKIGIDNYGMMPSNMAPLELLLWAKENNAEGVAFSGFDKQNRDKITNEYLLELKDYADSNELYIEWGGGQHIPRDMTSWKKKEIFENNLQMAKEAVIVGTKIIRSCSGGLMRWDTHNPKTDLLLKEMAIELKSQKQMLKDYGVILAIETHFEFTTHELLKLFDILDTEPGEYVGICLDTMNLLTMLEDPVSATERVLPWVVSTHIKDGGIILAEEGLRTFTTPIGDGIVDIEKIIRLLRDSGRSINLSIEDHGGDFLLPIYNPVFTAEFPDLTTDELSKLLKLAKITEQKMNKGECSVLEREKWPLIFDKRIREDIDKLKRIYREAN